METLRQPTLKTLLSSKHDSYCFIYYRSDGRHKMDRRRFETAHFKYAVLKVATRYPNTFQTSPTINTTLSETIDDVTPQYYNAFTLRYSGIAIVVCRSQI